MKFKTSDKPGASGMPTAGLFTQREKRRLIGMLVLAGVFGGVVWQTMSSRRGAAPAEVVEQVAPTEIVTPVLHIDRYRELAADNTSAERSVLETPALEIALADARLYNPIHYAPMGGLELNAARAAELAADSNARRGALFCARGTIEALIQYPEVGNTPAHSRGRMRLEDGTRAFFAFLRAVEFEFGVDDFVRIDGFFLKNFGENTGESWSEGPLLVGPRAQRSYPALGPVTSISAQDFVRPDERFDDTGSEEREEYWKLVSYTRDMDPKSVDWSQAPLLDRHLMAKFAADPSRFVATPIRLPPCRIQAIWRQDQGENPARVGEMSLGWIGATEWIRTDHPVLYFSSLVTNPKFGIASEVTARGYFLRLYEYEAVGGKRQAPQFVLTSIEPFVVPDAGIFDSILAVIAFGGVAMVGLFWYWLRRDARMSSELDAELIRRRRARRERSVAT